MTQRRPPDQHGQAGWHNSADHTDELIGGLLLDGVSQAWADGKISMSSSQRGQNEARGGIRRYGIEILTDQADSRMAAELISEAMRRAAEAGADPLSIALGVVAHLLAEREPIQQPIEGGVR